jgi:hypothetical protein
MDTPAYVYQPLRENGAFSIRLLTLLPGPLTTELQCEINEVPFRQTGTSSPLDETAISYEALSYTWGDQPKFNFTMFCNGATVKITQNLHNCLVHLRYKDQPRRLWIDAICINQQNEAEKYRQIRLMRDIYGKAKQVVIWLGMPVSDDGTQRALLLITRAAACVRQETGQHVPQPQEIIPRRVFEATASSQHKFPPLHEVTAWEPLTELFQREWFKRVWVYQESAVASTATVKIGTFELDWADLCAAVSFFSLKNYIMNGLGEAKARVYSICVGSRIGFRRQAYQNMPLITLLEATRCFRATVPKDLVIALLGLALEEGQFTEDDYKLSEKGLFTKVARYLLHHVVPPNHVIQPYISAVRLLSHVKHYPHETRDDDFPSWVPKWHHDAPLAKPARTEHDDQPMFMISVLKSSANFNAGGTDYPSPLANTNPATSHSISLEGFILSTITTNVNILRIPPKSHPSLWAWVLDIWKVRPDRHTPYPTGESIDEAFALTLTMAGTVPYMGTGGENTYHAIDFQHFCVSLYEQAQDPTAKGNLPTDALQEIARGRPEYDRLRGLVGNHIKSPTFSKDLQVSCLGRKVFCMRDGYIGVGDVTLESGDLVCVLFGGNVPFILREVMGKYQFIGECYVHGIMWGEALEEGKARRQWFELV